MSLFALRASGVTDGGAHIVTQVSSGRLSGPTEHAHWVK